MVIETLKPTKIQDIVFRIHEYLPAMRKMKKEQVMEFVKFMENYIKEYFANEIDDLELKKLSVELTDVLYIQISSFEMRDIHSDGYFGIVISKLFKELSQKNVFIFFILDNSIRDDRFKLTTELYNSIDFRVIYPYATDKLEYSPEYTKLPSADYKKIEKEIDEAVEQKKHILYVEKDDSVNYLSKVLQIGEEYQGQYVCVFRNTAPGSDKNATWLMGSFGDYLKS
jgi:hypothetical protein